MEKARASVDPLARVDPWTALRDGRMQLLAAIDRLAADDLERRIAIDGFDLRIPDAVALHVAWDRLHSAFFAGIVAGEVPAIAEPALADLDALETVEALTSDLDAARREMLEAASGIALGRYDERIASPWDGSVVDSIRGYLVSMAMRDGLLAEAIAETRHTP